MGRSGLSQPQSLLTFSSPHLANPRPVFEGIDSSHEHKYSGVQFHCDFFAGGPCSGRQTIPVDEREHSLELFCQASPEGQPVRPYWKPGSSGAKNILRREHADAVHLDVVDLVGDPKICEPIKNSKTMPNAQEQCFKKIEDHDFIPGLNLYSLDSDGDGLSDLQEIQFFNTSANNPDTDGDGKTDFDEVEAMTNPLGAGNLGDHLK
jgi:hypothetical protein